MCDGKTTTRFFRPWNVSDSVKDTVSTEVGEDRASTPLIKQEEDDQSVSSYDETSAASLSENEISSRCLKRRRYRRRSESSAEGSTSSRSCSVNSEDGNRSSNLDLLNNFVLASPHVKNYHPSSALAHESSILSGSSISTANGSPMSNVRYPLEYLQKVELSNSYESSNGSPTMSREPVLQGSTISTTGQPFYYEYPPVHRIPQGLYTSSVEQAVEMIHRQDVVAKQMKKLRPKKFRCEHCDVAFSNNGQLKGHVRIHTGERPFKCDAEGCGKSFTRNEELTRHKRIHTGLRPHACLVCGKRFGRKDHLKKHTRTHENRDPYRMSAAALGMLGFGHPLPQGQPFPCYVYPF